MKKSILAVVATVVLSISPMAASAQAAAQVMSGSNPRPQVMSGSNPRPQSTVTTIYSAVLSFFGIYSF